MLMMMIKRFYCILDLLKVRIFNYPSLVLIISSLSIWSCDNYSTLTKKNKSVDNNFVSDSLTIERSKLFMKIIYLDSYCFQHNFEFNLLAPKKLEEYYFRIVSINEDEVGIEVRFYFFDNSGMYCTHALSKFDLSNDDMIFAFKFNCEIDKLIKLSYSGLDFYSENEWYSDSDLCVKKLTLLMDSLRLNSTIYDTTFINNLDNFIKYVEFKYSK